MLPFSQQSTPELFFSLCISSLLKGAARNKSITSVQLTHNEEHIQQVEEVLTYLLTDLSAEERKRIGRSQCALESGLVCSCIEVLPISECHCVMLGLVYMVDMLLQCVGHGGICTVCGISIFCVPIIYCCLFHSHKFYGFISV